jgi:hypothetical protein
MIFSVGVIDKTNITNASNKIAAAAWCEWDAPIYIEHSILLQLWT